MALPGIASITCKASQSGSIGERSLALEICSTTPARRAVQLFGSSAAMPRLARASSAAPPADFKTLDQEVQGLKKDVIDLNKDLFVLEEELLFPANTQVALYVSMDVGTFFALDSVTVKIDNKEVKNYLYTAREADALLKGGVQRLRQRDVVNERSFAAQQLGIDVALDPCSELAG